LNIKLGAALLCGAMGLAAPWGYAQSLPELLDSVLRTHPSLRAQQALGESARQAVESAEWQFYPTPSIGFEQVDSGQTDPNYPSYGDKTVTTLRLQQPLWTGGRLTAGLHKAQAGLAVSQATLDGVRQDLAVRVVQVYADWLGAYFKIQAFEKSLKAHQPLQQQIERRIAGGASPRSDLTLLLGRVQQTEADLSAAQAQSQSALGRLSQMLGSPLQPQRLAQSIRAPIGLGSNAQDLLQHAQAHSPGVLKLVAQVRVAQEEVTERQADLKPEVYLRLESQYGSYNYPGSPTQNRLFVGASSHFGAGLSSMTQVRGAQARYDAALADVDSARVSLGEQVQADYAQAEAGQVRLSALEASLESSDNITRAWNRQFIAGRKTWLDVMNAMREQAQLEAQIADAKSSQLLLSWRLAITGRGLDKALALGEAAGPEALRLTVPSLARAQAQTQDSPEGDTVAAIPLYDASEAVAVHLRVASEIDPANVGVDLGISDGPTSPINQEGIR
jgi:adhesin transport system outer membrane protein